MRLRNGNIIVCDCGVERNPDISTPYDLIQYADGVATCSNCGASAEIAMPVEETPIIEPVANLEDRVVALEGTTEEIVVALNDKGLIP